MSDFRLNRVLSTPLTRLLIKTPLKPNQITCLSLAFGLLAVFFFSKGGYLLSLTAAACYQMAVVLDNCDGEVARAKNMRSRFGGWLDIVSDLVTDTALFLGVAAGMKRQVASGPVDLFLLLCLTGAFMHFFMVAFEKIKGFGPAVYEAPHPDPHKRKNVFLTVFDAFREGDVSWLVLILAVIGQTQFLIWGGGIYMQVLWVSAVLINFRWLFPKKGSQSA